MLNFNKSNLNFEGLNVTYKLHKYCLQYLNNIDKYDLDNFIKIKHRANVLCYICGLAGWLAFQDDFRGWVNRNKLPFCLFYCYWIDINRNQLLPEIYIWIIWGSGYYRNMYIPKLKLALFQFNYFIHQLNKLCIVV